MVLKTGVSVRMRHIRMTQSVIECVTTRSVRTISEQCSLDQPEHAGNLPF